MERIAQCVKACPRSDLAGILEAVGNAALEAGGILRSLYGKPHTITHKGTIDLVTEADVASEKAVLAILEKTRPDAAVLAEESHAGYQEECTGPAWIIDPLDGTTNFAHNFPWFAVSIAFVDEGKSQVGVIYSPMQDELFCACRGCGAWLNGRPITVSGSKTLQQSLVATGFPYAIHENSTNVMAVLGEVLPRVQGVRRAGAAALDLANVACGRFEGFWEILLKPWDTAAGILLVEEAGGRVSDFSNNAYTPFVPEILASNGHVHDELAAILGRFSRR